MTQWVANSPDRANAFILANAGFDVWMGNNRGSKYSLGHATLSTDDLEYWEFYQEEMGTIDVPTFIDFILDQTGLQKLTYVGHSEGTTQMFIGTSMLPEYYKQTVNLYVALAPVTNLQSYRVPGAQLWMAEHEKLLSFFLTHVLHYYNTFAPMPWLQDTLVTFCDEWESLCNYIFIEKIQFLIKGVDNLSRFGMYLKNMPSGASFRTFLYYG